MTDVAETAQEEGAEEEKEAAVEVLAEVDQVLVDQEAVVLAVGGQMDEAEVMIQGAAHVVVDQVDSVGEDQVLDRGGVLVEEIQAQEEEEEHIQIEIEIQGVVHVVVDQADFLEDDQILADEAVEDQALADVADLEETTEEDPGQVLEVFGDKTI